LHCLITGINHKGEGVARLDGKVVFIPYALPGETVEVEIEQEKKHFARGKIQECWKAP
jgi:23S rRNA (uracil1939-C5)-methyltransferase